MIDREFVKASAFAMAGAVLTFFGFMHSEAIGIGRMPMVAVAYAAVAVALYACAKYAVLSPQAAPMHVHDDEELKAAT